jgi:putative tricarboxylic transport membrane protein
MKSSSFQRANGYRITGGIGLVFSLGYLWMSIQFPLGEMDQPGAGVWPVIVATGMIVASLITLWEGLQMSKAEKVDLPDVTDRKRILSMVGVLFCYILILPWLGQMITSLLFFILILRILSNLQWLRIFLYSLLMSTTLYVVFITLLSVPMPRGILGF